MDHSIKQEKVEKQCPVPKIALEVSVDGAVLITQGKEQLQAIAPDSVVNDSLVTDKNKQATLTISANTGVKLPIFINWHNVTDTQKLILNLGENSHAFILESYTGQSQAQSYLDINLADNASLEHYRMLFEQERSANTEVLRLDRNAHYESFYLIQGLTDQEKSYDVNVKLQGEGAQSAIYGAYLTRDTDKIKLKTLTEHLVPQTISNEVFRGIVDDRSRVSFDGRILIVQDAQKTSGDLSNKNLLLSDKAHIDTRPELEIYADDVKCSHGATVSQLDELSLHYLKTRGIDDNTAKGMISFSFITEVLNHMPESPCRNRFRMKIAQFLGHTLGDIDDI